MELLGEDVGVGPICHDPLNGYTEVSEVGSGREQNADGGAVLLALRGVNTTNPVQAVSPFTSNDNGGNGHIASNR